METPRLPALRSYHSWIANETLEDYSLRYAAQSFRRWSPFVISNTALGGISFLALEAIGGAITFSYGFSNAALAILVGSIFIFITNLPISYYSSRYNIDLDLLTRGAGFGYIGSTITSLIYASFTFIFFALEGAIMAQALKLYADVPLVVGYIVSSVIIIPVTMMGITMISRLQLVTQPLWLLMMIAPFVMIVWKKPEDIQVWIDFAGIDGSKGGFSPLAFGAALSVMCSLVVQVGEQADYLRFLPKKTPENRLRWWAAVVFAGPGWILIGGLKVLGGSLLAVLALNGGVLPAVALEPIRMYIGAYHYVFNDTSTVLFAATFFVLLSQVKINVTNAYAGSLAWSNFFSRVTHYHPGRVVWLVFNILISLLLMLLGIFQTLELVLAVYSNIATAWIGAIVADLWVLKPLKVSPAFVEFKRAHLPNFNPVGCGGMAVGSLVAIAAFNGFFGATAQAYSAPLSFVVSFAVAILIGIVTRGRYYIARQPPLALAALEGTVLRCEICDHSYEREDMAYCSFYERPICSLCCSLEAHCHDSCKKSSVALESSRSRYFGPGFSRRLAPHMPQRLLKVGGLLLALSVVAAALFLLTYRLVEPGADVPHLSNDALLLRVFLALLPLLAISAWWIVLSNESRELAQRNLVASLEKLNDAQGELAKAERLATIGQITATVSHELRNPLGALTTSVAILKRSQGMGGGSGWRREVDRIQSNVERCARIIEDLLQFSRRPHPNMAPLAIDSWVELNSAELKELSSVPIEFDLRSGRFIQADGERLRQALVNLVQNSMQAIDERPSREGKIVLSTENVGDVVCLSVTDNGIGMTQDICARVFEPLFSTKTFGVGLGMAHVARIIERHSGTITITSQPGEGSRVDIRLPVSDMEDSVNE